MKKKLFKMQADVTFSILFSNISMSVPYENSTGLYAEFNVLNL